MALVLVLFLVPTAAAHTAIYSTDGLIRGSIGLLNEPAVTFQQTGLDACFTQNVTTSPRPAVAVNPGALTATLRAPDGQTFTMGLVAQFGRPGCITFDDPLLLTRAGQYTVDITGTVNGSSIASYSVNAGGPVMDQGDLTFPDSNVASTLALAQQVANLQADLTAAQARIADLEDGHDDGRFAPGAPAALLMIGLAGLVALRRR